MCLSQLLIRMLQYTCSITFRSLLMNSCSVSLSTVLCEARRWVLILKVWVYVLSNSNMAKDKGINFFKKGHMTLLKRTLFCVFDVSNVFMRFKVQKPLYFPHTVHYCCSSLPCLSETHRFLQSSSFWEATRSLIGQLSSVLWLAKLCYASYHIWKQRLHDMVAAATILQRE